MVLYINNTLAILHISWRRETLEIFPMSFMDIINNTGPNTEPCDAPLLFSYCDERYYYILLLQLFT